MFADTREPASRGPPRYTSKELGSVVVGGGGLGAEIDEEAEAPTGPRGMSQNLEGEPDKTLSDAKFVIGDYVSCAIYSPLEDGSVARPPEPAYSNRGMGGPPPRENGYGPRGGRFDGMRGGGRGGRFGGSFENSNIPHGEWRRGELPPGGGRDGGGREGGGGGGGYGRGRGRGRLY
ncbi:hypothetical protein K402DRAFT_398484 [Aulographum hederae CBS 113979]|uniref:Uncharacterized protein n=1 Tax=Aulographum hederae CBS 113979 TaxID=1176131 RepID=A0A6G1GKY0_9PEZI|nr:hypothetical protein K402DRAFT_398484 [Aulographum hederae CBS 113979]